MMTIETSECCCVNAEASEHRKRKEEQEAARKELERRRALELEAEKLRKENERAARQQAETVRLRLQKEKEDHEAAEAAALATANEEKKRAEKQTTQRLEAKAETASVRRYGSDVALPVEVSDEEKQFHRDARRFARLLVSEIKLFNEQEGREGKSAPRSLLKAAGLYRSVTGDVDKRVKPEVARRYGYLHQ